jgi:amidase
MLQTLGLLETLTAIEAGMLTPQTSIASAFARAMALEPSLQAFAYLPAEPPPPGHGPLAGITVGVKDLIDTADMPTCYGSPAHAGHRPSRDAAIVARLRALGASVLGKTVTTEFAFRFPGPTRNPHHLAHSPGGSSSGSAAAVGAGIVPLALGTQTLGSVIRPSAYCGIVGFKPSFGVLDRTGVHPLSGSLDHLGLMARSVDDIAVLMSLLHPDPGFAAALDPDPVSRRLPSLKRLPLPAEGVEPAQSAAFESAVAALRAAGAPIETLDLPDRFGPVPALAQTILAFEAARIFQDLVAREPARTSAPLRELVATGLAVAPGAYEEAINERQALRTLFAQMMAGSDALLTVPASGEAPHGIAWTGDPRFCLTWSFLGAPALTLPIADGPAGLPLGLQLVAAAGKDAALLRAAQTCAAIAGRPFRAGAVLER